jgi:hypothetical protein
MNFATLKQQVAFYLRTDTPEVSPQIPVWINQAQLAICTSARWRWTVVVDTVTVTPASGVGPYTTSKDIVFMAKVPATSGVFTLDPVQYDQRVFYLSLPPGAPVAYSQVPGQLRSIEVYPVPDTTYQVRLAYHTRLPDLTSDADENYLTTLFPESVIAYAVWKGLEWLGDVETAGTWARIFQVELNRMLKHDGEVNLSASFDTIGITRPRREAE